MTFTKWIAISLVIVVCVAGVTGTGCVSPFYGTARIEPGFHMDAGVAAASFFGPSASKGEYFGGRGDFEIRYGFNPFLQTNARIGAGLGYSPPPTEPPGSSGDYRGFVDGAIGVQAAFSSPVITPALRLEAGSGLWVTPLIGIGKNEILTLGSQIVFSFDPQPEYAFTNLFLTLHPWSKVSFFAGVMVYGQFYFEFPVGSIGMSFSIR